MSSTAAAPLSLPRLNGASALSAEALREAEFLQKILQIRDDVFASKHPRIHLPAKVIEQVAPRLPQAVLGRPTSNGTSNGSSSHLLPPRPASSARPLASPIPPPPSQRPFSTKSSSSSIDPVLLTKSEHLVKAEQQLKRQQIERSLKDQFDRKGRNHDAEEREALIDVEQCLIKAHQLVPPISGLPSTANNSEGAESFDENSYYSSKADSWSPEPDRADHSHAAAATPLTPQAQQTANQVTAHARPADPPVIDLDEEAYEPADDIEIYEPEPAQVRDDGDEEEDYSPPPADVGPSEPPRGRGRNRNGGTNGSSRRQSPTGPAPSVQNPRKRRREERREREERRRQQANKQAPPSPEPYIKEEPQSPPPFAYSDPQPSKRRALQPQSDDLEVVSAQASPRMQPVYHRDQEPLVRPYREFDEPSSPTVIRTPQRKAQRDDQDLRRVASLQFARRPYSPGGGSGELYAAPEPRQIRAASHAFLERAEVPPAYREASARPAAVPRYIRERSRSPVHEYIGHGQPPMLMAPPPRRIVVDQYGNKYYAAPVDARESMAPPSRRIEVDPYYERAVTREPTMRAPARTELYDEDVMQRMPPPPRRYVEASEAEMMESPYRHREASRRPVEVDYRPGPQYDEMGPPREYPSVRSYSMRPEGARREMAEGYVRHESIQPLAVRASQPRFREVSVIHQEPFDERRYISAPQGRRYVDEGPMEAVPEPFPGEARHVYARY